MHISDVTKAVCQCALQSASAPPAHDVFIGGSFQQGSQVNLCGLSQVARFKLF